MDLEKKKKEEEKNLLIYGAEVLVPLSLTVLGSSVMVFCDLSFLNEIVLGGTTFLTGFQTVNATGIFHNDIIDSFKKVKKYKSQEKTKYLHYPKK